MKLLHPFLALVIALLPLTLNADQNGKKIPDPPVHAESCKCPVCRGFKKHNAEVTGKAAAPNHCRHNMDLNKCDECNPPAADAPSKPTARTKGAAPVKPVVCPTCGTTGECPKCQKSPTRQAGGGGGTVLICSKCGGKYVKELQHLGAHVCPAPKDTVPQGRAGKAAQVGSCSVCGAAISEGKSHICKPLLDNGKKVK